MADPIPQLDLADIQGFILRGYTMPLMRHFVLRVDDAPLARWLLGALAGGEGADEKLHGEATMPQITSAAPWEIKPACCLNIGLTFEGLKALGLPPQSLGSFPEEFVAGAVARAAQVGDVEANAPANWKDKMATPEVHAILFLTAQYAEALEATTATLRALLSAHGLSELSCYDGEVVCGDKAHFGYRDGFSQPNVQGAPPTGGPDPLPVAQAGAFVLGYESQHPGLTYAVPTPAQLGHNGSFLAYRILQQDCKGFEAFLEKSAAEVGMDKEMVAAKVCGRWRNGIPLALSPETDAPEVPIPLDGMNNFDYVPSPADTDRFDDSRGLRCPIGSHIRRANPRGSRVAGGGGNLHRLMRRGLPYGPLYDPENPDDGIERGLLGLFICASLKDQFEFLMAEWIDDGLFAPGLGRAKDVILGRNSDASGQFSIPSAAGTKRLGGFGQFITTRGAAYCFLPSITALKYLQQLA